MLRCVLLVAFCLGVVAGGVAGATTYTRAIDIVNSATADYFVGTLPRETESNEVSTRVCTQAALTFHKYAPGAADARSESFTETRYCPGGGSCDPATPGDYLSVPLGARPPLDPRNRTLPLIAADQTHPYHVGELIFFRLADGDRNLDPAVRDVVALVLSYGNDREWLLLEETARNSGVFSGYLRSARPADTPLAQGDGTLTIVRAASANTPIVASYDDVCASVGGVSHVEITADALVDPFGVVFDTTNGKPVDGATVTLVDVATGQPARVFGDDGVSAYPATLVTGSTVQDASGAGYVLPEGGYRFPYVQPGNYRLDVVPPANYRAPSLVPLPELKTMTRWGSSDTFAIDDNASLGRPFVINPGPALHIDYPIDPLSASLWVTKSADRATVAIGDFLLYRITVENTVVNPVAGVTVTDRLPVGLRYQGGSTRIDGVAGSDPTIGADGRTLTFGVGTLQPGARVEVRFVVAIGAGARPGKTVNYALAAGDGGITSNTAEAAVLVKDELFRSTTFIVGRVFPNGCGEDQTAEGVEGVRIYLEDGTYTVTDKQGLYHFEGIRPGTHVVQIDPTTVPEKYEIVACEDNTRFGGTPYAQFVDAQGGTLWRADFYLLARTVRNKGDVSIELRSVLAPPAAPQPERRGSLDLVLHPHFESGRAELSAADKVELDRLVAALRDLRIERLKVTGHTDSQRISARLRPVFPDNYALSRARAASVADYLVAALGLDPALVTSDGKGPDEPVAGNDNPAGMARNRRVELQLTAMQPDGSGDPAAMRRIAYEVPLRTGEAPLGNARLSIILPPGVTYVPGSSSLEGSPLRDPQVLESVLTYRLGELPPGGELRVTFTGELAPVGETGELRTQAMLTFDTAGSKNQRTPVVDNLLKRTGFSKSVEVPPLVLFPKFESGSAELSAADRQMLDEVVARLRDKRIELLHVTGHTDAQRISLRLRSVYPDNYALSQARAASVASYLAAALQLPPSRIASDGFGPDQPVASNDTPAGMALNRRVELRVRAESTLSWYDLENVRDRSPVVGTSFDEILSWETANGAGLAAEDQRRQGGREMPDFDAAWLAQAAPGLDFAWPPPQFRPAIPVVKLAVKHDPQQKLVLLHNGTPVDPLYFDGTRKRDDLLLAVSTWYGVPITEGANLFEAIEFSGDGGESRRVARNLHYAGAPVKVELWQGGEKPVADGKKPTVVSVRLTDRDGFPAREGVVGEFKVNPPYLPYQKVADLQKQPLVQSSSEWSRFVVGEDGVARIELQPTTQTGEAVLRFKLVDEVEEVRSWLAPAERDWILVGFGEGTAGYNTLSGHMEGLGAAGADDRYYDDGGRVALFAKGTIRGEWLLTMAYASDKPGVKRNTSLFGTIDPDEYYTLYGDETAQQYEAASARSLYLKIERGQFYALFGDYATGLTVTELSRYSRSFNGLKSEMKGEHVDFNLFVSDTNQAYVREEIRGDGTSGLYRLSRSNIVLNSEAIAIEVRDRFRSEVIVDTQKLTRHIDYDIDYDRGTLYFKSPVYSRDENLNPVYIVAEYESADPSDLSLNYGGRGAVRFAGNRVEIGATHVHEGRIGGDGDLNGLDLEIKVDEQTTVKAEVAATRSDFSGVSADGNAYLAEVTNRSERFSGSAYVRRQSDEFGLGQQNGSESGTLKVGGDGTYDITETVSVAVEAFRQETLATEAVRTMVEEEVRVNREGYTLHAGLRHVQDDYGDGVSNDATQLTTGGSYNLLGDKLVARLDHDQSLYNNNPAGDYPTRTTFGLDYKLSDTATLFAAQELTYGSAVDTATTRIGMKAAPWNGGQVSSTVEQQRSESGTRLFSVSGLKQTWQLTEEWSVDAGMERSDTLSRSTYRPINGDVAPASGGTDFTAVSGGVGYKTGNWSWDGRVEVRTSAAEDKWGVMGGAYGEIRRGLGISALLQTMRTDSADGTVSSDDSLRLGVAYRPREGRWIVLNRLDLVTEEERGGGADYANWRVVDNVNLNWKPDRVNQLALQYGLKYLHETIDGASYGGYTDLLGIEGRRDLSPRWDVGIRGSLLHSWDLGQVLYSAGPSVGYRAIKNVWLSVGYNLTGFQDRDFSAADYTAQGPYVKFRFKFDQNSVREALRGS